MQEKRQAQLQLFAEGGPCETGGTAAGAGQMDIGGGGSGDAQAERPGGRPSWQEILADPEYRREYDAAVQSIVQKRLRARAEAEAKLESLGPVLEALGRRYAEGGDLSTLNAQELAETILNGESRAERARRREEIRGHLENMMAQERAMRAIFPEFDLQRELKDRRFVRLTAPGTGLTLEDAYCAMHHRELRAAAAEKSLKAAMDTVRAGRARPRENAGGQAASTTASDPRRMTKEQREELKKRIYDAKAQGRTLPYGG